MIAYLSRWMLTIALLVTVGFHAHWSVTACLTLNAISGEMVAFILKTNRLAGRLLDSSALNRGAKP